MNNENIKIFTEYRSELLSRQLSNSEKYDAAILTLSMAALGVSVSFIKDVVDFREASLVWALSTSWIFFGLSIVLVIASFLTSNMAIEQRHAHAYKYYIEEKDEYLNKKGGWVKCNKILNHLSGLCFIIAVILTVTFACVNFEREDYMSENNRKHVEKGADVPIMQPKPNSGSDVPTMVPTQRPERDENTSPSKEGND